MVPPAIPPATPTWNDLMTGLSLRPGTVAHGLAVDHDATPWDAVGALFQDEAARADPPNTVAGKQVFVRRILDSLSTKYFLVVHGGQIRVWYGLKLCHHYPAAGVRVLGLMGDYVARSGGQLTPPKLYKVAGAVDNQPAALLRVDAPGVNTKDSIIQAFDADADLELMPAANAADGGQVPTVTVWKALEIHPKLVPMFLPGLTPRKAFEAAVAVTAAVPPSDRPAMAPLLDWVRAAVISDGAVDNPSSLLSSTFEQVDPHSDTNPSLETWYYDLLSQQGARSPTAPAPPGGSTDSPSGASSAEGLATMASALRDAMQGRSESTSKAYHAHETEAILRATGFEAPYDGRWLRRSGTGGRRGIGGHGDSSGKRSTHAIVDYVHGLPLRRLRALSHHVQPHRVDATQRGAPLALHGTALPLP